jgi:prepilin-type N-terminal cleavage/methylation domain-containing protein
MVYPLLYRKPNSNMNPIRTAFPDARGFTLIEMMMVVAVMSTVLAMTVLVGPSFLRQARADSGTVQVMETLRVARETAISQRRNVQIRFPDPCPCPPGDGNEIQTLREEIPAVNGTTPLQNVILEGRVVFSLVPGVPDTPDRFGGADPPPAAIAFGASVTRMFTSEGTLIDSNGDPINGTLFMSVPGTANSSRAITIFGITGLMRAWRWNGSAWVE